MCLLSPCIYISLSLASVYFLSTCLVHVYMHAYACLHAHQSSHTYSWKLFALFALFSNKYCMLPCAHSHVHMHTHTHSQYRYVHACIYTNMPTRKHAHIQLHMETHTTTHAYRDVCMNTCMLSHTQSAAHTYCQLI